MEGSMFTAALHHQRGTMADTEASPPHSGPIWLQSAWTGCLQSYFFVLSCVSVCVIAVLDIRLLISQIVSVNFCLLHTVIFPYLISSPCLTLYNTAVFLLPVWFLLCHPASSICVAFTQTYFSPSWKKLQSLSHSQLPLSVTPRLYKDNERNWTETFDA